MKKTYMLLAGIFVALIICANPMQQLVRSYNKNDNHTEIRKKRPRPFPASHLQHPNGLGQAKAFI